MSSKKPVFKYTEEAMREEFEIGIFWGVLLEGLFGLGIFLGSLVLNTSIPLWVFLLTIPTQLIFILARWWYKDRYYRKELNDLMKDITSK